MFLTRAVTVEAETKLRRTIGWTDCYRQFDLVEEGRSERQLRNTKDAVHHRLGPFPALRPVALTRFGPPRSCIQRLKSVNDQFFVMTSARPFLRGSFLLSKRPSFCQILKVR